MKMLHGTQLSFIQLGGGVAVGVNTEQRKYYTLFWGSRFGWSSIVVCTMDDHTSLFPVNIKVAQ